MFSAIETFMSNGVIEVRNSMVTEAKNRNAQIVNRRYIYTHEISCRTQFPN